MFLKSKLIYIVIFLLGIFIGVAGLYVYFNMNTQKIFVKLIKSGQIKTISGPSVPIIKMQDVTTMYVVGDIVSFSGNTITLKKKNVPGDMNEHIVTVTLTDTTKFTSIISKSTSTFQKEMKDFQDMSDTKKASSLPPKPYIEKEASRDVFTMGKLIIVKSSNPISSSSSITAESVSLLPEVYKLTQ